MINAKGARKANRASAGFTWQTVKKILAVLLSVLVILVSLWYLRNIDNAAKNTITVVRVSNKNGIKAGDLITETDVERYELIAKEYYEGTRGNEYSDAMVRGEDIDEVIGRIAGVYLHANSIIFADEIIDTRPKKNEWLYELPDDTEVITIPYNYLEAGGDILVPGDRIRVRYTYEVEEAAAGAYDDYNPNYTSSRTQKTRRTEILFESVEVRDMLNTNAHSVYEVYNEMMKLDERSRQEALKSKSFLASIKPRALLLVCTAEDVERYAQAKSIISTSDMLITILKRDPDSIILDQLPTLETEVKTWIGEGESSQSR